MYFSCNFPTGFCNMLVADSWTFLIAMWAGLQLLWCGPLCLYQIYYALFNTTTYETIKSGSSYPPKKNPYDRGILRNLAEFASEGQRWFDVYPQPDYDVPREKSIDLV